MATSAPSSASASAVAAPIPRDPPVTSATLEVSFFVVVMVFFPSLDFVSIGTYMGAWTAGVKAFSIERYEIEESDPYRR